MKDLIVDKGVLEVAVDNIQSMSHEDYALKRKNFFGASDSSILCGVNLYKTLDELLKEKNNKCITKEEKEVGEKAIVRKGYDLEPIILNKAEECLKTCEEYTELYKPEHMYKFKNIDGLSVNYDGVLVKPNNVLVPVEAKLVSKYGEKYYNKSITIEDNVALAEVMESPEMEAHIKKRALRIGIPAYYYTQVQQEIMGLDAPYGYLAALFDETWTFKLYYIPRDRFVQDYIAKQCADNIDKIKRDTD